jgi:hypothetical protein
MTGILCRCGKGNTRKISVNMAEISRFKLKYPPLKEIPDFIKKHVTTLNMLYICFMEEQNGI